MSNPNQALVKAKLAELAARAESTKIKYEQGKFWDDHEVQRAVNALANIASEIQILTERR